ncbi:hypothetical protein AB1Y20_003863 [Prymnesium parvum]|uniref:Peroxin-19 n=1 Tax=Prymnesium parvum TaxID=97485 RepID=A0AB34J5V2_PRYPA
MEALLAAALDEFDEEDGAGGGSAPADAGVAAAESASRAPAPTAAVPPAAPVGGEASAQQGSAAPPSTPAATASEQPAPAPEDPSSMELGDMEATLRALAASAEKLTEEVPEGDEAAMLAQFFQKLSNPAMTGDREAMDKQMMELLQQLGGLGMELGGEAGGRSGESSSGVTPPRSHAASGGGAQTSAEALKDDAAMDGLLDTLVGQLLSKEVMLEPMEHLHAEFPRYLEANESTLSAAELARYRKQQALVEQILEAYRRTPDDTDRIAALMQEMQQQGPPPPSISGPVGDGVGCSIS